MKIGLSKYQIENELKEVFIEELTPQVGLFTQERIASTLADIIVKNNQRIENEIDNRLRELERKLS